MSRIFAHRNQRDGLPQVEDHDLRAPTGNKVALVPETIYGVDVLGPWLKDGLPADVTGRVYR